MKKLFTMFSARPHHNITDCKTPQQNMFNDTKQDQSLLPMVDLQNQTYSYQDASRNVDQDILEVNENKVEVNDNTQAVPVIKQITATKVINEKIKTVRIRLIDQKANKDLNRSKVSNIGQQTYKAEIKAKDLRFKQIAKTMYIFYTPDDLLSQISTCSYFNGFKPLNFNHIKQSLFPQDNGIDQASQKKKKTSIQQLKYYVTQTDEGEYHGQMNKNKSPEGNSILFYKNGNIYCGEMKNRFRHGQGMMVYPDGSSYTGGWELDAMEGQGKEIDSKGETFIGSFSNNSRSGKGTLKYKNGYVLECNWVNGYQNGIGTLNVGTQTIQVEFSRGQIVKVNQTHISDLQNGENIQNLMPHLIEIKINRDKVKVSQSQQIPSFLTARF